MITWLRVVLVAVPVVSASAQSGSPASARRGGAPASERAAILALRADHNRAIAAGDTEGVLRIAADDHVSIFGGGRIVRSKDELRSIWTNNPQRCARMPRDVEVGTVDGQMRAAEIGTWRCDAREPKRSYSGSYFAHWSKRSGAWRVVSDTYVSLACRGEGCQGAP